MTKDVIKKLGKIFFTQNNDDKNNQGLGLGLYISSKILKM